MVKAKRKGASSDGRAVFRIMISVDAKRNVEDIVSTIGITHIALASKLITWFADQPSEVQAGIVGPMFEGADGSRARNRIFASGGW